MRFATTLLLAASVLLASCAQDRCATASNPAECRAWSDAGGDIDDYLAGAMIGYMLSNRGGQTVIIRDNNYRGSYRPLRRPLYSESQQIRRLNDKIARQKAELRRQQEANLRKKQELKKSSAWYGGSSSSSSSRKSYSSSSYRSSSSSSRRSRK